MSEKDLRAEVVRHWWEKARESPNAARRELAAGAAAFAINRAYYSLFYGVSALLLEEGRRFRKHAGVRAAFNKEIVKVGRLDRQHGELYNRLFRIDKRAITSNSPSLTRRMCNSRLMRARSSSRPYGLS